MLSSKLVLFAALRFLDRLNKDFQPPKLPEPTRRLEN
jgi:hypothetical protein